MNTLLQSGLLELNTTFVEVPPPSKRELDLPTLQWIQHLIFMLYQASDN